MKPLRSPCRVPMVVATLATATVLLAACGGESASGSGCARSGSRCGRRGTLSKPCTRLRHVRQEHAGLHRELDYTGPRTVVGGAGTVASHDQATPNELRRQLDSHGPGHPGVRPSFEARILRSRLG